MTGAEVRPDPDASQADSRYDELWRRHRQAVLGYLVRRCADREDAADLLAETFTVAWRRLPDVPEPPADRPWLFGVARHVLSNHRRGLRRRSKATEELRSQLRQLVVPEPDVAALALRQALARLEPLDREVLTLGSWEDMTAAEIGLALELSATAVSSRQSRARARLRALLGEEADEPSARLGRSRGTV